MTTVPSIPTESPAFARKASSYDAYACVQEDAADWLAEWLPTKGTHGSCLELGAGTGLFSQHLAGRFQQLACTDISPEMLSHCRKRVTGADFRILDAWEAPDCDRPRWDLISSCSLLQWAPTPVSVLRNWSKQLEPNGRMLLGFFVSPSLPELDRVLEGKSPVDWRSPSEWQKAIGAADLQIQQMETTTRIYHYPSALEFWKSLHGTGSNVTRGTSTGTLRRLLREYEGANRTEAGVRATWTFCRAELVKQEP